MKRNFIIFGIIIIIILLILVFFLIFRNPKNNKPDDSPIFPVLPEVPFPLNTPLWYSNNNPSSVYNYPEEYYSNKPLYSGSKNTSDITVGIAFSGGGIRAACSTCGVLQALNSYIKNGKSLLNRDYISYMSSNSGSTWALLSILYQPIEGSKFTVDQILGQYKDPNNIDYSIKGISPNFLYNAVNNNFDVEIEGNWWIKSVANSFFKPYGLYDENTKGIVGIDNQSISSYLSTLGSKYRGIVLRDNMPIPIAISTIANKIQGGFSYIPIDSTPISSGFIVSKQITELVDQNPTIKKIGGRVSTFAFNTNYTTIINPITEAPKQNINIENFETNDDFKNIKTSSSNITFSEMAWEPAIISGTSSFAPGPQLLKINLPDSIKTPILEKDIPISLLEDFVIQTEFTVPTNIEAKIIDGYLFDDTGIVSLLVRKTQRISVVIDIQFTDIQNNIDFTIGNSVFIINGQYQNNFAKISSINSNNIVVTLFGMNTNTIFFDKATVNDNLKQIDINQIKNTFTGEIPLLDNYVIGIPNLSTNITPSITPDAYTTTINGMIQNYAETGIFYFQGIYNTIPNNYTDIIKYEVEILWYCLSPSPNFVSLLSDTNKSILNNMFKMPNICTLNPIYNDCNTNNIGTIDGNTQNYYEYCQYDCIDERSEKYLLDMIINTNNVQKITDAQALGISTLTAWVTTQIIIPFINGDYGIAIQKPTPIPTFTKTIMPTPGPKLLPKYDKLLEFIKFVVRPINNVISKYFDNTNLNIIDTLQKFIINLGSDNAQSKQIQEFINSIQVPVGAQGTCILGNLQVAKVLPILGNIIIDTFNIDTENLELIYNQDTISLNCKINGKVTLSNFKLKIYLSLFYNCEKNILDQEPTSIVNINDITADISGITNIENVGINYSKEQDQYTLDFSNSNLSFKNVSAKNYSPEIKNSIMIIVNDFFTQQWFIGTLLAPEIILLKIIGFIDLFQDLIQLCIDEILQNVLTTIDTSFIKKLGQFPSPFPCDLCKITCPTGKSCICQNGGTFVENKGLCDCINGWYGENCSKCLPNYDNRDGTCSKCLNGFIGNNCEICPSTYDKSDNTCTKCLNNWYGDKCQTCPPHFDETDGLCIKCLDGWIGEKCDTCSPTYDNTNGLCNTCLNAWSGDKCDICDPLHFDNKDKTCSKCLNAWYTDTYPIINPHLLCNICPKYYDNTDGTCSKCKPGFTGPNCLTCLPIIPITQLTANRTFNTFSDTIWVIDFGNEIPIINGVKDYHRGLGEYNLQDKDDNIIFNYYLPHPGDPVAAIVIDNSNVSGKYAYVTIEKQTGKIYYMHNVVMTYGTFEPNVYTTDQNYGSVRIYPQVCLPDYTPQ